MLLIIVDTDKNNQIYPLTLGVGVGVMEDTES